MIVFPILNFVLPLMFSSFLLVGTTNSSCNQCKKNESVKKVDIKVSEIKKTGSVESIDSQKNKEK
mgnify:FL=1